MALVPLLIANRGLTSQQNPSLQVTGDLVRADNVDLSDGNLVNKEGGSVKVGSALGSPIRAGTEWWPTVTTQRRVVVLDNGTVKKDDMTGAFATTLTTGLTLDPSAYFVQGGQEAGGNSRKLFIFTGSSPVKVLAADGATVATITSPPADWTGTNQPLFGFIFRGSQLGAGGVKSNPDLLYFSDHIDHEDFVWSPETGSIATLAVRSSDDNTSQICVAARNAFGRLFIWKYPVGVYAINDAASDQVYWYPQLASSLYGCPLTPHGLAAVEDSAVAFITSTGQIVLMQETGGTNLGVSFLDLTRALNLRTYIDENFELSRLKYSQLRWYDSKKQLHVLYATKGALQNDRRLIIDFNEQRTRVHVSTKDEAESIWTELDSSLVARPVIGDADGQLWKLDQSDRNVDSVAYTMTLVSAPTDFRDLDARYAGLKNFRQLHMEYVATGNFNINVTYYLDGKAYGPIQFNQSSTGTTTGTSGSTFPLVLPFTFEGTALRKRSKQIAGQGNYFAVKLEHDGLNQSPRISQLWAEFDVIGTRR